MMNILFVDGGHPELVHGVSAKFPGHPTTVRNDVDSEDNVSVGAAGGLFELGNLLAYQSPTSICCARNGNDMSSLVRHLFTGTM